LIEKLESGFFDPTDRQAAQSAVRKLTS